MIYLNITKYVILFNMNICKYKNCKKNCIQGSDFCYLSKHNNDKKLFNTLKNNIKDIFFNKTVSSETYSIIKTEKDGSCFYKSLANYFFINNKYINKKLKNNDILIDRKINILECLKNEYNYENIQLLCEEIQLLILEWIINNRSKKIKYMGYETLENLVLHTHNFDTFDEYIETYSIISNRICNNINTRWGGLPEQVAITEILNIRLDVYEIVKLDTTKLKMISCTTKSKDHRFKKIASLNVNSNHICNLLFENMSNPHYSLLNI